MKGMWKAASKGDTKDVEKMLKKGCDPNELDSGTSRSWSRVNAYTIAARRAAIHYAAEANQVAVARVLVAGGAAVNMQDGNRDTVQFYTSH